MVRGTHGNKSGSHSAAWVRFMKDQMDEMLPNSLLVILRQGSQLDSRSKRAVHGLHKHVELQDAHFVQVDLDQRYPSRPKPGNSRHAVHYKG